MNSNNEHERPRPTWRQRINRFLAECMKLLMLVVLGGLVAVLSSYLMRQFGY